VICPPEHRHGASQWCYDGHRCRCVPYRTNKLEREKTRRKLKAYGRFEGRVNSLGTKRRIQGLQVLGWTQTHIGDAAGYPQNAVSRLLNKDTVTPQTRDRIKAAAAKLTGRGPDEVVARHAVAKGWVSLYAWDDPDVDDEPSNDEAPPLSGDELIAEIDWLIDGGTRAEDIATAVNKSPYALERMAQRHERHDLTSLFYYARKRAKEAA
jgi:transcriptional regulator with XRE-family HTH domain